MQCNCWDVGGEQEEAEETCPRSVRCTAAPNDVMINAEIMNLRHQGSFPQQNNTRRFSFPVFRTLSGNWEGVSLLLQRLLVSEIDLSVQQSYFCCLENQCCVFVKNTADLVLMLGNSSTFQWRTLPWVSEPQPGCCRARKSPMSRQHPE